MSNMTFSTLETSVVMRYLNQCVIPSEISDQLLPSIVVHQYIKNYKVGICRGGGSIVNSERVNGQQ